MCFDPSLISLLPPLPPGVWNDAHISRDPKTGGTRFSFVSKENLLGITDTWHPTRIDHLMLEEKEKLRSNVYEVTCPVLESNKTIIAKFARFEWEIAQLQAETTAYKWIEGQQIGPEFLGHLTEEGRVIGFLISKIENCRHAEFEDLSLCEEVLLRLHRLGIRQGDTNKQNFLVHDGKTTLIDFDCASRVEESEKLEVKFRGLGEKLLATSGRGRIIESDSTHIARITYK
ncbi:alpha-galactosidase A precursor [Podospora fimiseda]|uniref:Alpha-galactosidase A n=1 Tax=Podospora fimiseda TaxID=252190 RepID=A0AAN7H575_9PEZI|nr:alpha-galactosidase A precursor [Podospora fimiseda]